MIPRLISDEVVRFFGFLERVGHLWTSPTGSEKPIEHVQPGFSHWPNTFERGHNSVRCNVSPCEDSIARTGSFPSGSGNDSVMLTNETVARSKCHALIFVFRPLDWTSAHNAESRVSSSTVSLKINWQYVFRSRREALAYEVRRALWEEKKSHFKYFGTKGFYFKLYR